MGKLEDFLFEKKSIFVGRVIPSDWGKSVKETEDLLQTTTKQQMVKNDKSRTVCNE